MMILLFLISVLLGFSNILILKQMLNLKKEIRLLHSAVEEHDGLIQSNIDNTVHNGTMIVKLETYLGLNQHSCPEGCEDNCLFCPHAVESDT